MSSSSSSTVRRRSMSAPMASRSGLAKSTASLKVTFGAASKGDSDGDAQSRVPPEQNAPEPVSVPKRPSSSWKFTTSMAGGSPASLNALAVSNAYAQPRAPSSHPPVACESEWLPQSNLLPPPGGELPLATVVPILSIRVASPASRHRSANHPRASRSALVNAGRHTPFALPSPPRELLSKSTAPNRRKACKSSISRRAEIFGPPTTFVGAIFRRFFLLVLRGTT
mmetsp:Transcript_10950/g.36254  ORF Transcript_10950/g.36254 Transcript_10950/m.36254 type:complete len:225 (-) Transcript_10950:1089-1763(-)